MGIGRLQLSDGEMVRALRTAARLALANDGDRDHMNHSNLKCEQTMAFVRLMRAAADRISGAIDPLE